VTSTGLPLLFVWQGPPDEREWSPTGINGFLECQRKWAWKKIAKLEDPGGAGANLGKRSHSMWETYLGTGQRPDFVTDKEAASVASLTLHLLPQPKTPGMTLERHFRFKSANTGHVYHGFKDFELPPGAPQPQLELDGSVPIVGDHKTSKNIDAYAKSIDTLQDDAQSVLYGLDAMARFDAPAADLAWIYAQTKGAKHSKPVVGRLHRAQALKVFNVIEQVATEASAILDSGAQPLDLPPTIGMCREYGGCPFERNCNLSPSQKARSRMSNSVIDSLRARVQGTPAPVQEAAASNAVGQVDTKPEEKLVLSDRDVPAPTEIPKTFLGPSVGVNPPEGTLPTPPAAVAPPEEPKEKRKRRTKAEMAADEAAAEQRIVEKEGGGPGLPTRDPVGADAHAHASHIGKMDSSSPERTPRPVTNPPRKEGEDLSPQQCDGQAAADAGVAKCGFTLYVDCIPIGRPARQAAGLFAKAHEKFFEKEGVADYRLVDYGKGAPAFIAYVDEQVDGSFDLALDTRTPEGTLVLETLAAKASFVVRGLR
jgi:hypothetical protein